MVFTGSAIAATPAFKPNTFANATQFSRTVDDAPPLSNNSESITSDNIHTITQNETAHKPVEDFHHKLRKTTLNQAPQQDQDNKKATEQGSASHKAVQPDIVQNWLAQYRQTVQNGKEGFSTITDIKPKAGYELAQLLTSLKAEKSPPVTGKAAKSAEVKLLVTINKGQLGLKTILPDTSKGQLGLKTVLPQASRGQPGPKTVLTNISEGTADTQPGLGNNFDTILVPNSMVASTKAPGNGEKLKELTPNALINDGSKTILTNAKTASGDNSVAAGSTKSSAFSSKKLGTDILVDNDSKTNNGETTTTNKSAIPGNEKTPMLNINFPPVQTKLTESQSQPVGTTPEKSAQITAKPSDSAAATTEIASESSGGNGKESPHAWNKLSDNPTVQELNITAVQVSTGKTKNHGNSASSDSSDSDHKQILSHNNLQTPVTEQSHNSAEGRKAAALPGQTSLSSVSANIGKQILESIHSSLSREGQDQQITIRLNPPELGKVFIKFDERDSQIIGLLEVSKPQTRIEIQQALPHIIQNLQDSGIHIKRLEVVLSNGEQPEQEAPKDSASGGLQNGWTQQHDSTNSNIGVNNPDAYGINEWLINSNNYENITDLHESLTTEGSINMLV